MNNKACGCVLLLAFLLLCLSAWLYVHFNFPRHNYSDGELYSFANECIINKVGIKQFNEELPAAFKSSNVKSRDKWNYKAPEGSCLDKVAWELPGSALIWDLVSFCGKKAVSLRFGCHFNYAYLVAVDPSENISSDDKNVKRIAENIAVVYDYKMIHYYRGHSDGQWPWVMEYGNDKGP